PPTDLSPPEAAAWERGHAWHALAVVQQCLHRSAALLLRHRHALRPAGGEAAHALDRRSAAHQDAAWAQPYLEDLGDVGKAAADHAAWRWRIISTSFSGAASDAAGL